MNIRWFAIASPLRIPNVLNPSHWGNPRTAADFGASKSLNNRFNFQLAFGTNSGGQNASSMAPKLVAGVHFRSPVLRRPKCHQHGSRIGSGSSIPISSCVLCWPLLGLIVALLQPLGAHVCSAGRLRGDARGAPEATESLKSNVFYVFCSRELENPSVWLRFPPPKRSQTERKRMFPR